MNIIQQAEQELDEATRAHHSSLVAERAARNKVKAAAAHLANLQYRAIEIDLEIERARKEGELRR